MSVAKLRELKKVVTNYKKLPQSFFCENDSPLKDGAEARIEFDMNFGRACPCPQSVKVGTSHRLNCISNGVGQGLAPALPCWILNSHSQATTFSLFFNDMPHSVRRDIFTFGKSDIATSSQ